CDIAYDAVLELWRRRKSEGWKQTDLASALGKDTAWISRKLKGPGNWTFRTFGALVQAMKGDVEIKVHAVEDPFLPRSNYHSYAGYELDEITMDEVPAASGEYRAVLPIKPRARSTPTESGELAATSKVLIEDVAV